jgi:SAM-dependent methyltransferase
MTNNYELKYVKNVYEDIAIHFSNTRVYSWNWISEFISKIPIYSTIVDIGCGNGRNMLFKNYNFIGIDNCENFIKICLKNNQNVILGNMINVPLKDKSCDAIISIASFHHLSNYENRINCLLELKRILKDNGKILLSTWSKKQPDKTRRIFEKYGDNFVKWNKFGKIYERYYYIFTIDELYKLFKKTGLLVLKYEYDCGNDIFTLIKN